MCFCAAADANGGAPDKPSSSEAQTRKADNNAVSKAEAKSGKQSEVSKANGKADGHSKSAAAADARAARASDKASDRPSADKCSDRPSADKGYDRPSGGRSGQKRSRSRSPLAERRSKAAREHSSDARHAKAADTKRPATRQSSVRNGKVADPETSKRKEWVYQDKVCCARLSAVSDLDLLLLIVAHLSLLLVRRLLEVMDGFMPAASAQAPCTTRAWCIFVHHLSGKPTCTNFSTSYIL